MITLALDAATYQGTVAVIGDGGVLAEATAPMRGKYEERLMPAVSESLGRARVRLDMVDRIVCGAGPGSFTSLRIAASLAKGMALGAGKPLFAVSSLALVVAGNVDGNGTPRRYLAVFDALRDECFVAAFEVTDGWVAPLGAERLVPRADVPEVAAAEHATPVGPDQALAWQPHARGTARLAHRVATGAPVDLASWEPAYGRLAAAQVRREARL